MSDTVQVVQGDTLTPFGRTLVRGGRPVDLTGKTVKFIALAEDGTEVIPETTTGVTAVAPLTSGKVQYDFQSADVATARTYYGWFRVYDDSLTPQRDTFPNNNQGITITVVPATDPTPIVPTTGITAEDIATLAKAPRKVQTDEGTVEERPVKDLILADQYASAKAATAVPWGIKVARGRPGSTTSGSRWDD